MPRAAKCRPCGQAPEELEVPPRGAAAELAGLTGVWAAVKYLVSVGAQHMDLIQAHAQCAALSLSLLLSGCAAAAADAAPARPAWRKRSAPGRGRSGRSAGRRGLSCTDAAVCMAACRS